MTSKSPNVKSVEDRSIVTKLFKLRKSTAKDQPISMTTGAIVMEAKYTPGRNQSFCISHSRKIATRHKLATGKTTFHTRPLQHSFGTLKWPTTTALFFRI